MTDLSSCPTLPLEIFVEIIESLEDCSETLKACALVDSNLAPILHFETAYEISGCVENDFEEVYTIDIQGFRRKLESLITDLRFWPLGSPMSLATAVRSLTIHGLIWPATDQSSPPKFTPWPQGLLAQLPFTELVRIHALDFMHEYGHTIDSKHISFRGLLKANPSLETLVLEHVDFSSVKRFLALFRGPHGSATPRLQTLSLVGIGTPSKEQPLDDAYRKLESFSQLEGRPRLQALKFSDMFFDYDRLCAFIPKALFTPSCSLFDLSHLHTLMITQMHSGVWKFYKGVFIHCGPTITLLKVDVWPYDLGDQDLQKCLRHLVNLKHLELRLDCSSESIDSEFPVNAVNICLPLVPRLEYLCVVFRPLNPFRGVFPPKRVESALSVLRDTTNPHLKGTDHILNNSKWGVLNSDDIRECVPMGNVFLLD
ncbi:hypothetical protein VKT23_018290 [Stygiomarasmius scandens]|uniref:F-box domain-containing protein n=1 Tax=Marasmiellus scandens TaxID=2682957 RepID=A0ABR1ISP9_9AGAR